jgi:hypothetical protein
MKIWELRGLLDGFSSHNDVKIRCNRCVDLNDGEDRLDEVYGVTYAPDTVIIDVSMK